MANPYTINVASISTDQTNYYVSALVSDGVHTLPPINITFTAQTTAAQILTYLQNVVNNQPVLPSSISAIVGITLLGQ